MNKSRYGLVHRFLRQEGIAIPSWIDDRLEIRFESLDDSAIAEVLEELRQHLPQIRQEHNPRFALAGTVFPKAVGDYLIDRIIESHWLLRPQRTETARRDAKYRLLLRPQEASKDAIRCFVEEETEDCQGQSSSSADLWHLVSRLGRGIVPGVVPEAFMEKSEQDHEFWCLYCQVERGYQTDDEKRWVELFPEEIEKIRSIAGLGDNARENTDYRSP